MELPAGLPGFPDARRFALLHAAESPFFHWLQSIDEPDLAFVVADTAQLRVSYDTEPVQAALAAAGVNCIQDLAILAICTVPPPPAEPTVNLLAPVAVCTRCRRGAQAILHGSGYRSREPIFARLAG